MDLCEDFAAFLTQLRHATKELLKKRDLWMKKSVDMNSAVVDEVLQTLETSPSYSGPSLNPVA